MCTTIAQARCCEWTQLEATNWCGVKGSWWPGFEEVRGEVVRLQTQTRPPSVTVFVFQDWCTPYFPSQSWFHCINKRYTSVLSSPITMVNIQEFLADHFKVGLLERCARSHMCCFKCAVLDLSQVPVAHRSSRRCGFPSTCSPSRSSSPRWLLSGYVNGSA